MKYLIMLLISTQAHGAIPVTDYSLSGAWASCHVNLVRETNDRVVFYSKYIPGKIQYVETDFNKYKTYTVDFSQAFTVLKINQSLNPSIVRYLGQNECKVFPIGKKSVAN